jgi:hypothetical protein
MTHSMSAVDIISDVEYTTTKWSEKDEWTEWNSTNRNMSTNVMVPSILVSPNS